MLDAILPAADEILVTQAHHPRAADPQCLAQYIANRGRKAEIVPIEEALDRAMSITDGQDLICGTGSLFVVAELRAAWFKRTRQPPPSSDPE